MLDSGGVRSPYARPEGENRLYPMKRKRLTHQERRSQTRKRLLDAARQLFTQRGYLSTSLVDIAEAAGHTRGAFYSNFCDKSDLLLESLRRARGNLNASHRAVLCVLNHCLKNDGDFYIWVEAGLLAARDPAFREQFDPLLREAIRGRAPEEEPGDN